jgi:hypothetical protein
VESVVGGGSGETVAVLQWVWGLFAIDVDGMDRGGANGGWRDGGRGQCRARGSDEFIGEPSARVEILFCHFGLEDTTLFGIDFAAIEDVDGLQGLLVRAKLGKPDLCVCVKEEEEEMSMTGRVAH